MRHPTTRDEVALATEIGDRLNERVRAMLPEHRSVGKHTDWRRKDALAGKIPVAGVFPALFAAAICNGTPKDALMDVLNDLEVIVLRERAEEFVDVDASDWMTALVAQAEAQGRSDTAEFRAMSTRATSDKRAARDHLLRHRASIERALVALDRSIADDEERRAHARRQLREMLPAS